ncbi:MAG: hypothetical protein HUJ73_04075 [Eubacterium sp.]|nr:hypothetical protein [Eubacterium sp.]
MYAMDIAEIAEAQVHHAYDVQQEQDTERISPAELMQQYENCFLAGCTSPFLYLKAWEMLAGEEALLRELTPFMTQVLCFGQKQGLMTRGLLKRAAVLSGARKQFEPAVLHLLSAGYEKWPEDDVLEAVCQTLIKGDPMRKECFPWYESAVRRDIRITRMYEFYMETCPYTAEEQIPQAVRTYFATNHTLGEEKSALLYAGIILHMGEDETDYLNYEKHMQRFALESLRRGRINKNYAILYAHFFPKPATPEIASLMAKVLFTHRVAADRKGMRRVIVCHNALKGESVYPCRDGVAYPKIYSEDACVLFEDEKRRRFAVTVACSKEPLFRMKEIAAACMRQGIDDAGLELFLCREKAFQMDVNSHTLDYYKLAERNSAFTPAWQKIVRRKLLEFDLEHPERQVPACRIREEDLEIFAEADRSAVARLLMREGRFRETFRILSEFGFEHIPPDTLLQVAEQMIREQNHAYDEELLFLSVCAFSEGKSSPDTLLYMRDHYEGPAENLCRLWKALSGTGIDPLPLEEKILVQASATTVFPEEGGLILEDQIRRGGNLKVTEAYLKLVSEWYFMSGRKTDDAVFRCLEEEFSADRLEEDICRMALLKYYSACSSLTEEQKKTAGLLLGDLIGRGYRFAFYRKLPKELTEIWQLEDKYFVEGRFRPDARVVIQYRCQKTGEAAGELFGEPMRHVYKGIFNREFSLFRGESVTYNLRVMTDGKIRNSETGTITAGETDPFGRSRYALLNRMLEAREHGSRESFLQAMRLYLDVEEAGNSLPLLDGSAAGAAQDRGFTGENKA